MAIESDGKIAQSGHIPQSGHDPKSGALTLDATEARQGLPVRMVRRVLALSLISAIAAMVIAYLLR